MRIQTAGAAPWRQDNAEFRLLATPREVRAHTARIDLPRELKEITGKVFAHDHRGQPLQVRPVSVKGEIIALEIALPQVALMPVSRAHRNEEARPAPFYVYLAAPSEGDAASPAPPDNSEFQPVTVHYNPEQMIARPWRFNDVMTHAARQGPLPLFSVHHDFAPPIPTPRQRGRAGYRYRLGSLLKVDQPATIRFAVNARHTGWFLFLNQQPLLSWQEAAEEEEDLLISDPVNLDAGLHGIDLYVFQRPGEEAPRLHWAPDKEGPFTAISAETMVSPQAVAELVIEHQTEGRIGGYRVQSVDRLLITGRNLEYQAWTIADPAIPGEEPDAERPAAELLLDRRQVIPGQAMLFAETPNHLRLRTQRAQPNQTPRQYTIPLHAPWPNPLLANLDFVITRSPVIIEAGEQLRIEGRFGNLPDIFNRLDDQRMQVQWRLSDGHERTVQREVKLPGQAEGEFVISVPLVPDTARIMQTNLTLDHLPLGQALETHLIPPRHIPAGLGATGGKLTVDGHLAILLVPREKSRTGDRSENRRNRIESIVIADEFWAVGSAPGAHLPLATLVHNLSGKPVEHVHIGHLLPRDTARPDLLKFNILPRILSSTANTVVWAVGPLDLRQQQSLEQMLLRLRFLVEATLAHDKLPVLCTIPPVPGIEPTILRQAAIAVMQMGLDYGIPVIDLHSRAGLEFESAAQAIDSFFRHERHQLQLLHPNNSGRRWFAQMLNEKISELSNVH